MVFTISLPSICTRNKRSEIEHLIFNIQSIEVIKVTHHTTHIPHHTYYFGLFTASFSNSVRFVFMLDLLHSICKSLKKSHIS